MMKIPIVVVVLALFLAGGLERVHCYLDSPDTFISKWLLANKITNNRLITDLQNVEIENLPIVNKDSLNFDYHQSSCQLVQIVHLLHQVGCQPKAISSFACSGSCPSYVQMSTSKFWQHERSCSCCQQTGLQEATFTLDCPALDPPYREVKTYAPVDCMCRACTDLGKENIKAQELVEALAGETTSKDRL